MGWVSELGWEEREREGKRSCVSRTFTPVVGSVYERARRR